MKKEIRVTKCNKEILNNLISQMKTVNKSVTMCIGDDALTSIGYFSSKDVVKLYKVANDHVFESIEQHDRPIRITLVIGEELQKALRIYRQDEVVDMILYVDDEEAGDELYAYRIALQSERLHIGFSCADKNISDKTMTPLTQDIIDRLLDVTGKTCSFTISSDYMSNVKQLSAIDSTLRSFGYRTFPTGECRIYEIRDGESDGEGAQGESYYVYNMCITTEAQGENIGACSYMGNKNIFTTMDNVDWHVDICKDDRKIIYKTSNEETGEDMTIIGVVNDAIDE